MLNVNSSTSIMNTKQQNKMAKENGTTTAIAKEKKSFAPRKSAKETIAQYGKRGVIAIMAQIAFNLGHKNKFDGTGIENRKQDGSLDEPTRQNGTVYHLTRDGKGIILNMDEKSELFKNVLAKAKACKADLEADEPKYSKNVQSFIKTLLTLKQPSENKAAALKGISLD